MKQLLIILSILLVSFTAQAQKLIYSIEPVNERITFNQAEITPLEFTGDSVLLNKRYYNLNHSHVKDTVQTLSITDWKDLITPGKSKAAVNAVLIKLNIQYTKREK